MTALDLRDDDRIAELERMIAQLVATDAQMRPGAKERIWSRIVARMGRRKAGQE